MGMISWLLDLLERWVCQYSAARWRKKAKKIYADRDRP
jgi:hypothetical protein